MNIYFEYFLHFSFIDKQKLCVQIFNFTFLRQIFIFLLFYIFHKLAVVIPWCVPVG